MLIQLNLISFKWSILIRLVIELINEADISSAQLDRTKQKGNSQTRKLNAIASNERKEWHLNGNLCAYITKCGNNTVSYNLTISLAIVL